MANGVEFPEMPPKTNSAHCMGCFGIQFSYVKMELYEEQDWHVL